MKSVPNGSGNSLKLSEISWLSELTPKQLATHSIGFFARHYLNRDAPDHQMEWYDFIHLGLRRKHIEAPRGHGKSEALTYIYPLWRLALNHDLRILIVSENYAQGEKYVQRLKSEIENNGLLQKDFGLSPHSSLPWRNNLFYIRRPTSLKDPSVEGIGVGKAITGGRFDVIICDDILSTENQVSEVQRESIWLWFTTTLSPILEPSGRFIVIGTRKNVADLYGQPPDERTGRKGLLHDPAWHALVQKAIIDEKKRVCLWPERWTYDLLMEQRKSIGHYAFSQEYQNSPIPLGGGMFKLEWLQFYDHLPTSGILGTYMGVDPATGTSDKSSHWGMAVITVTDDMEIYIRELYNENLDAPTGLQTMYQKAQQYNVNNTGMETVFHNESFLQWISALNLPTIPITPLDCKASGPAVTTKQSAKKTLRILNLTVFFQNHQIYLPSGAPWLADFINQEYGPFPDCVRDDRMDALEMAVRIIPKYSQEWKFY